MAHSPRVSLVDVARAAGKAPATVSHALNGTGKISPQTAERVRRIAEEMGYRPNRIAASLRRRRTSILGVLVPMLGNPFYSKLVEAIETAAQAQSYSLLIGDTHLDETLESHYCRLFLDQGCDGIIIVLGTANVGALIPTRVPLVLVNLPHAPADIEVPAVEVEQMHGMYSAVAHLIRLGHRRIGLLSFGHEEERRNGYRRALIDAGIAYEPDLVGVIEGMDRLASDGCALAGALLQAHPDLTAIAATADLIAIGVLQAAHRAGRRVPEDLAVVGFDDIDLAAMVVPPLTTVAQPIDRMAAAAVELAVAQINEGQLALDRRRVRLETRLIVRESCGSQRRQ